MILIIASFVAVTILAIAFHEAGHYFASKKLRLLTTAGIDKKGFYVGHEKTSVKGRYEIVKWGVIAGYVPGLLLFFLSLEVAVLWFIGWSISNYREIKLLYELEKEIGGEER